MRLMLKLTDKLDEKVTHHIAVGSITCITEVKGESGCFIRSTNGAAYKVKESMSDLGEVYKKAYKEQQSFHEKLARGE